MKRSFVRGILFAVSMFCTGCSSLTLSSSSRRSDAIESAEETLDWKNLSYEETSQAAVLPDYTKINDKEKYLNLSGQKAFHIQSEHSAERRNLRDFKIETMLPNGTFLYGYSTTSATDNQTLIHCAALYQYSTERFKIIHETSFSRSDVSEEKESFYMQTCSPSNSTEQQLFIYDNGKGYLYTITEDLVSSSARIEPSFVVDIEGSVLSFFQNAVSVSVTNAMTDGDGRFYIELTLEKKEVELEEGDGEEGSNSKTEEKKIEEEAEKAEKELEENTVELVLIYDFTVLPGDTTINQLNLSYETQKKNWIQKADGKTFTAHPDAENDWKDVVAATPDNWSMGFLSNVSMDQKAKSWLDQQNFSYHTLTDGGMPVLQWNGGEQEKRKFSYSDSSEAKPIQCTFQPVKGTYHGFVGLTEQMTLSDVFIPLNGSYYELYGKTGTYQYYGNESISRTYTYEWTDEENQTQSESVTQTLTNNYPKRKTTLSSPVQTTSNAYLEGYEILDSALTLYGAAENQILCLKENTLYWLKQDGSLTSTDIAIDGGAAINLAQDGTTLYYLITSDKNFFVKEEKANQTVGTWSVNHEDLNAEIINPKRITEASSELYLNALESHDPNQTTWESITGKQFQKTTIQKNTELLDSLKKEGVDISKCTVNGDGFLLTTFRNGLLYYDFSKEPEASVQTVVLNGGTWYGTWKKGNQFVSVGFSNENASYTTLDAVNAMAYEYTLNDLYKKSLDTLLDKAKPPETVASTEETIENHLENIDDLEDMQDTWNTKKEETLASADQLNALLDTINQ